MAYDDDDLDDFDLDDNDDDASDGDADSDEPEERARPAAKQRAGGGEEPAEHAATDLDDVSVPLSFEMGTVQLTLGELRTLTQGSILLLEGASPGSIAIMASGRVLGRGEAVDVDGCLGIRIVEWSGKC